MVLKKNINKCNVNRLHKKFKFKLHDEVITGLYTIYYAVIANIFPIIY